MERDEVTVRRWEDRRGPAGTDQVREVRTVIYFRHEVQIANRSDVFNLSLSPGFAGGGVLSFLDK